MISWQSSLHFSFVQMSSRENFRLFFRWISIANELPPQGEEEERVVGLSRKENREFWKSENRFNHLYIRFANSAIFVMALGISVQYFLIQFEIDFWVYLTVQLFHASYTFAWFYFYFHCICTPAIFCLGVSKFIAKKFRYLAKQARRLSYAKTKRLDNRRVTSLIHQHNHVEMEVFEMNVFFRVSVTDF